MQLATTVTTIIFAAMGGFFLSQGHTANKIESLLQSCSGSEITVMVEVPRYNFTVDSISCME
jgi:hypothetical protein